MEGQIIKKELDEYLRLARKYWATGDKDILTAEFAKAHEICEKLSIKIWHDVSYMKFIDFLNAFIGNSRIVKRAFTNDDFYKLLEFVGFEIVEGEKEECADF